MLNRFLTKSIVVFGVTLKVYVRCILFDKQCVSIEYVDKYNYNLQTMFGQFVNLSTRFLH